MVLLHKGFDTRGSPLPGRIHPTAVCDRDANGCVAVHDGAAVGNSVMAFAHIVGTVGGAAADLLICWDLAEQVGQDRRVTDVVPYGFDGPHLQCLFVNSEVGLAPDAPFGTAMLAGVPLDFTFDLDAGAVDQQVQWAVGATIRNVDGGGLLAARQRAKVGYGPVQTD